MREIQDIVKAWLRRNFDHLESDWDEAGGFHEMIDKIAYDVAGDVESDLECMVEENLRCTRRWEIGDMIESRTSQ